MSVGRAEAADIEADLEVTDAFGLPAAFAFVRDDDIFGGQLALAIGLGVQVVEQVGDCLFGSIRGREDEGGGNMADGAVTRD